MAVSEIVLSLLLLISDANFQQDPQYIFRLEGEESSFFIKDMYEADYYLLYRRSTERDLLLLNSSESYSPRPGYSVKFVDDPGRSHFALEDLTVSQSGDYRVEGWTNSSSTDQRSFYLTICIRRSNTSVLKITSHGGSLDLCESNPTAKDLTTIQLYRT